MLYSTGDVVITSTMTVGNARTAPQNDTKLILGLDGLIDLVTNSKQHMHVLTQSNDLCTCYFS